MRCCRELLDAVGRRQPWDSRSLQQTDFKRSLSFLDLVGLGEYLTLFSYSYLQCPNVFHSYGTTTTTTRNTSNTNTTTANTTSAISTVIIISSIG